MTSSDPMHEFFEALFKDPIERRLIIAAIEGRDPDEVLNEILDDKQGKKQ